MDKAALRRRLERAERLALVGEIAASVAHEIKNPLAPIRGYAQLLGSKLDAVSERERPLFEKGLQIILEEVDRIDRRIGQLLGLARAGAVAPPLCGFDLNQAIAEVVALVEAEPNVRGVVQQLDPAVGQVAGSPDELKSALTNVLRNAAEAMQDTGGGVIEVKTLRRDDRVEIIIQDEGAGLPKDEALDLFEAFYTTKPQGTGLGLAIARSAVEAAGGTIRLEPRQDRPGAIVRIELDRVA